MFFLPDTCSLYVSLGKLESSMWFPCGFPHDSLWKPEVSMTLFPTNFLPENGV